MSPCAGWRITRILILGISTWDFGELQEDWESRWEDIADLHLEGRIVALFGLGDQLGYGEWFQDALGMLHDQLVPKGVKLVGYWPNEGYEFDASKALIDDGRHFVGLALDDANQYDQTDPRIEQWVEQNPERNSRPALIFPTFWQNDPERLALAAGRSYRTDFLNRYHRMTL